MGRARNTQRRPMTPRRALVLLVVAAVAYGSSHFSCGRQGTLEESALGRAHDQRRSDVLVEGEGRVVLLMGDDTHGARHQHLLLEVPQGFTVKLAHNIDLAPRVPAKLGDTVEFRGVYEFNEKGGVVHWTHRDPDGKHPGGWLRHKGRVYE